MGDDLKASIEALSKDMALMHESIKANAASIAANAKAIAALATTTSSSTSGARPGFGDQPPDRPPKHWRPDFPHYDGKSDPLIFINRCESFFLQQRIMQEEKVWMASHNLLEGAQIGRAHV